MKVVRTIEEFNQLKVQHQNKSIGFVPTMGYLHEGHTSLMQIARKEQDLVVASIFVNPLQFGPDEDYDEYPRDELRDEQIAQKNGVDILFLPDVAEIYPKKLNVSMSIKRRADVLCAKNRPGHFNGVITVLTKLFNIVQPDVAYFGLKDAQQVAVVASLIEDLNFPIKLHAAPTIREDDGLAKSSRNVYLSASERKEAKNIYQALLYGRHLFVSGDQSMGKITSEVISFLKVHTTGKIDYVDLLSYPDLKAHIGETEHLILAVAIQYEQARLIDNIIFNKHGEVIETITY